MAKYLVIVESPAKVKTIKKFLGENYEVLASQGHVRDLPKSEMGIDVKNDYEPKYITIRGKGDILKELRTKAAKASKIYLATDPDREGEAISWHLYHTLKLEGKDVSRISFNEITKNAVRESIKNARKIDQNLVDAQQARRVLDRVVGYNLSPLLWAKVKRGLSAGRVQSAALKLICDRENEIDNFIPEEYWTIDAELTLAGSNKSVLAEYYGRGNKRASLKNEEEAKKVVDKVKNSTFAVEDVKKAGKTKKAPLPFTTSTLQQEAGKSLNFTTQKTMRLAQELYEGVQIKGKGTVALITYLRTDSVRISKEAKASAADYILEKFGKQYLSASQEEKGNSNQSGVQDAHEAIRPTDVTLQPIELKDDLSRDLYRLYNLIWKRFLSSQMADAVYDTSAVKISADGEIFTLNESHVVFDGFLNVYKPDDEKEEKNSVIEAIDKNTGFVLKSINPKQHFTAPAPHFTESSLVKTLEELSIGRPSTYAPTITTLVSRHYVKKDGKNLFVSELGDAVNSIMSDTFPEIVDTGFTAKMEAGLDDVADGKLEWKSIIRDFYPEFETQLKAAEDSLGKVKVADELSDEYCDLCGRQLVIKYGPHGKFQACPGFPECRFTKPYFEKIGINCPKCGNDMVVKHTKKGRLFFGCNAKEGCDYMLWQRPVADKCPKCGMLLVKKANKLVCMTENCQYVCDSEK